MKLSFASLCHDWYDIGMQKHIYWVPLMTVACGAFLGGFFFGTTRHALEATSTTDTVSETPTAAEMEAVWKAWNLLEQSYVAATSSEEVTKDERIWGMISGLASSYEDPYTTFMPPLEKEGFDQEIQGTFGGVGVEIGMREGILTVIAPLKGTPAEAAGIRAGDFILEVDGHQTQHLSIDETIHYIRGEVGTEVLLTIAREGEREFLKIPVTRAIIEVPTIETKWVDDVFVIALYNFGGTSVSEMRKALRTFVESGRTKLVLDLRGNPGGYLEAAVEMASWFLPVGQVVVVEDYGPHRDVRTHRTNGNNISTSAWRLVILTDGGSASASEILAGALREHNVGVLIGEKTFGKGSVQEVHDITPDTSLKVTVARWLTPHGISISHNGLTPDLVVHRTSEDIEEKRDPQLDAAVAYLHSGVLPAPAASTTATSTGIVQ
jgi:carboxyl-terminal processing protease